MPTCKSHPPHETPLKKSLIFLMAASSGAVVANLYYNQPLLGAMARDLGIPEARVALVPTLTQVGYGLGLLFITPLGDRTERRRLIALMVLLAAGALVLTATLDSASLIIGVSLLVGLFSVVPMLIVPFAATLAGPSERSRVVGTVMSGLIIGILLARTASGFIAAHAGWRTVYWSAAVLMVTIAVLLRYRLPHSRPAAPPGYIELITSLPSLWRKLRPLQEAAISGALLFAAFSFFWTTLAFRLESAPYHMGTQAAGLFGLVGASGASAATVSGRLADRVGAVRIVLGGLGLVLLSWMVLWLKDGSLVWLGAGAVLLDFGVQAAHVANQSRIFAVMPEARSRINTVYMVSFFIGGATGSIVGAFTWANAGWSGVCTMGMGLMVVGIAVQGILARQSST